MLFKLSLLFRNGQWIFCPDKKIWAIFGPFFGPKFGHFCSKIRFSDIFFETTHQICLKLGQKLRTVALNHQMAVLCLGNFIFSPFWPFLGDNTLHVVTFIWFWAFWTFSVNLCYLNFVYGLEMINEKAFFYLAAAERP